MKKLLELIFCKRNFHFWKSKYNPEDSWYECMICKKQIEFTEEEYKKLEREN